MFEVKDDLTIYCTRGDVALLSVTADENGVNYIFQPGEVVRMQVFEKKDCQCVVMQKDVIIEEATDKVDILLTAQETRICEVISKPKDFWYEVELNPETNPQTIIGYDEDGPKVFKMFPEGKEFEDIGEEDFPFIDSELSATSRYPVENRVITAEIEALKQSGGGAGEDGFSPIANVTQTSTGATITITDKSGTTTATVTNGTNGSNGANGKDGEDGKDGKDGRGIKSVARTSGNGSAGTTDTYTITYTDNTTSTFTVYNGKNGTNGSNGANGKDGEDGKDGKDGRGIKSIARTSGNGSAGTTDTYTITYTDNTTSTFTVYNGANGKTPVKGTDYFTTADINEIVNAVYAKIADGNGVAY